MGISRAHEAPPPKVARVYKGKCGICHGDIFPGQVYYFTGGSKTSNAQIVHFNCYKPSGAPTWEELKCRREKHKG